MRGRAGTVVVGLVVVLAVVTLGSYARIHSALGLSAEEYRWEGVFQNLAAGGFSNIFRHGTGSYRPVCGCVMAGQGRLGLSPGARHATGGALFVLNAALLGLLVARLAGRKAAVIAVAVALTWSTSDEVVLWLGGRCDLMLAVFGLLGALCVKASAQAAQTRSAVLWAVVAALAAALAALSKETGVLLPLVWLPLVPRGRRVLALGPAIAAVGAAVLVRFIVMSGVGPYVAAYVGQGPFHWARSGARALALLAVGPALASHRMLLVAACSVAACAAGLLGLRFRREPWTLPIAVSLGAALAPCVLLATDRALYPVVLVMAALVGLAFERWPSRAFGAALVALLAWHSGGSVIMQRRWADAYRTRALGVDELNRHEEPGAILVLVAPRQRFNGLHLEPPIREELPVFAEVVWAGHVGRAPDGRGLGVPSRALLRGPHAWSFDLPSGVECSSKGSQSSVVSVRTRRGALDVEVDPGRHVVLVHWDETGRSHVINTGAPREGRRP